MANHPLTFTDATFEADVLNADEPVLIDFWAPWCGPCRAMAPLIEELADEFAGHVKVGKVNSDENPQTAARYRIRSIPTLLILQDGEVVDQVVGLTAKQQIASKLEAVLDVPA